MKYLIVLFLFLAAMIQAQELSISGHVLNLSDQTPLNYVTITIDGSPAGAVTDGDGFFEIHTSVIRSSSINFSRIGFEAKKIKISDLLNLPKSTVYLEPKLITSQTILVEGSLAKSGSSPITFAKLDSKEIKQTYAVQDVPQVLSYLPSMNFYSENGNGIGYNYLSIRGFDQRRISVSVNGIPQNDPEDHNVYWLDFPDLIENTGYIQVQRGAGNGLIGFPAVGGAVNIITSSQSDKNQADVSASIGTYNTRKYSAQYSSGIVAGNYSFSAKLSEILSSGYRQGSWTDLKSFYFTAARYDDNLTSQLNIYGGPVADGLAYMGLPKFAVKDKNLRIANYSDWGADQNGYTYTVARRPQEIENFSQPHFELLNELRLNGNTILNSALFCVLGRGFFDYDGSWADTSYLRMTGNNGFNMKSNPQNTLIHAMVDNRQWGWIPRISFTHDGGELIVGGELRIHRSEHWGNIRTADDLPANFDFGYRYYSFNGAKDIASIYMHENYKPSEEVTLLLEAQLAYHRYGLSNEMYVGSSFDVKNTFFNPRFGINYKIDSKLSIYLAAASVSREPRLVNYYDAAESSGGAVPQFNLNSTGQYDYSAPLVKPESMSNLEIGGLFSDGNLNLSANGYFMSFKNEIVKQGQVDRFGEPVTGNMSKTIHYGVELSSDWKINKQLQFIVNATFSRNYINSGSAFVNYTDITDGSTKTAEVNLDGNDIAGFPNFTFNARALATLGDFYIQAGFRYIGSSYSDNYGSSYSTYLNSYNKMVDFLGYSDNKVDGYLVADLYASYESSFAPIAKKIKVFFQVNNLFDNLYAAAGIGKEFFPAAERNFLMGLKFSL